MDAKDFATRLVKTLRKRSTEYLDMSQRHNPDIQSTDDVEERAVATALNETADCIEEALATFDED